MDEMPPTKTNAGEGAARAVPAACLDTDGKAGSGPVVPEEWNSSAAIARRRTQTSRLMEQVVDPDNLNRAYQRVVANKGSPGPDGMTVGELGDWARQHKQEFIGSLLDGSYQPTPVRGVKIPKPGGGQRQLGIPTVKDRLVQQAMLQVLTPLLDPTFSPSSYGFRPKRSAHDALRDARTHVAEGYGIVVDIDLEKFFDRVNHDILMGRVAKRIRDKRLLKLIRGYLEAGVLEHGVIGPRDEGTPQGGPLSPLLSNLLLDDLDRELERRGHRFVRYADDCNVYVRSERAGLRVMEDLKAFLSRKLKLKVNESKSAVERPHARKFLGFSFTSGEKVKRRIAPKAILRFKERIRELTRRTRGVSIDRMIEDLRRYLIGWRGYFGFCETPSTMRNLEGWMRRRLRCFLWKQWKLSRVRFKELTTRGVGKQLAAKTTGSSHGPWRLSNSPALSIALNNAYFRNLGLPPLTA